MPLESLTTPFQNLNVKALKSMLLASSAMLISGTIYVYSLYGPQMCDQFRFNQTQSSFLSFAGPLGVYLSGPLAGKWVSVASSTKPIFLLAASSIFIGFASLSWMMKTQFKSTINIIYPTIAFLLVGLGSSTGYHASLATNIKNFSVESRGISVGIPVSFFGLSAYFFSLISVHFVDESSHQLKVDDFLAFMALSGLIVYTIAAFLLYVYDKEEDHVNQRNDEQNFDGLLNNTSRTISNTEYYPIENDQEESNEEELPRSSTLDIPDNDSIDSETGHHHRSNGHDSIPLANQKHSLLQTITLLLPLAYGMIVLCGVGLMYLNNVGTMVRSLENTLITPHKPHPKSHHDYFNSNNSTLMSNLSTRNFTQSYQNLSLKNLDLTKNKRTIDIQRHHVGLISICNFLGRSLTGIFSDFLYTRYNFPRIFWLLWASIIFTTACFLASHLVYLNQLSLVTALVGLGYGTTWTSMPMMMVEYFGPDKFASFWGWMTSMPAIGGESFSLLFGWNYDQHKKEGMTHCIGNECFVFAFDVAFIFCASTLLLNAYLIIKGFRRRQ